LVDYTTEDQNVCTVASRVVAEKIGKPVRFTRVKKMTQLKDNCRQHTGWENAAVQSSCNALSPCSCNRGAGLYPSKRAAIFYYKDNVL